MAHPTGFGTRIAEARHAAGLSQRELAEKTGYTTSAVQAWELGTRHPRYDGLKQLADALGITVADLYADSSEKAQAA